VDKMKHGRRSQVDPDSENYGFHRPYWKHAHHDWRLWVAVGLMLLAMFTYVMGDDLAWRPRSQLRPSPSSALR
jgi:hypothetical protein